MVKKTEDEPKETPERSGWYKPDENSGGDLGSSAVDWEDTLSRGKGDRSAIEWTASEFVAHEKGVGWYASLALVALAISGLLYLLTHDVFSIVVILIMAAILGVSASRKPKVVLYRLERKGLTVGDKLYRYDQYKSFATPNDGPFLCAVLIPLRRLEFPVSVYLAPDSQQKAIDLLATHLPFEHKPLDRTERLMRELHF